VAVTPAEGGVAPWAPALPRLRHPDPLVQAWADGLVRAIDTELQKLAAARGGASWALGSFEPPQRLGDPAGASRTIDPATATLGQTAAALATLVLDLRNKGTIP
jgi:hypothetical protein